MCMNVVYGERVLPCVCFSACISCMRVYLHACDITFVIITLYIHFNIFDVSQTTLLFSPMMQSAPKVSHCREAFSHPIYCLCKS